MGWEQDALCAQVDPELFFPPRGGSTAAAKRICGMCPVRVQCRRRALELGGSVQGIWGATSKTERRVFRRALMVRDGRAA